MNIGIVVQSEYPKDRDVRARKIAKFLSDSGNRVFIVARRESTGIPKCIGNVTVYNYGYFSNWRKISRFLNITIPFNLIWMILKVGIKERLKLIIIRDLRPALPGILAAKLLRVPVIVDFAENFPAMNASRVREKIYHHFTRNRGIIAILEKLCASLADHIWVVVEENKERLSSLGIDEKKISVVSNTPELVAFKQNRDSMLSSPGLDSRFRIIFLGILSHIRGLDLILRSIPYILEKEGEIELIIVGDGDARLELESLTKSIGIENVVKFTGWVKPENIPDIILKSDVGLIPHVINEHTQTTIPNKLFDYMAAGVPVVSTDIKPVRRIIEAERCGIIIPNNPKKVAEAILELKASSDMCMRMGENGRKSILKKYNWDMDSKVILNTIEHILCKTARKERI